MLWFLVDVSSVTYMVHQGHFLLSAIERPGTLLYEGDVLVFQEISHLGEDFVNISWFFVHGGLMGNGAFQMLVYRARTFQLRRTH